MAAASWISPGDDLVASAQLYRRRYWGLHGHVAPFFGLIYPVWLAAWIGYFGGPSENLEPAAIALAGLALLQILVCLGCYWSVHFLAAMTCSKAREDIKQFEYVKTIPFIDPRPCESASFKRPGSLYLAHLEFIRDCKAR